MLARVVGLGEAAAASILLAHPRGIVRSRPARLTKNNECGIHAKVCDGV
jgi:hypothetical protein